MQIEDFIGPSERFTQKNGTDLVMESLLLKHQKGQQKKPLMFWKLKLSTATNYSSK